MGTLDPDKVVNIIAETLFLKVVKLRNDAADAKFASLKREFFLLLKTGKFCPPHFPDVILERCNWESLAFVVMLPQRISIFKRPYRYRI